MKFIDFFAGVGGFRRGLELSGHKCVGFCEWDKYAAASYTSMHLITEEQRKYLSTLSLKQRQKEILKEKYRNGEWYSNDIRNVDARGLPEADCWCFGAPCQDFSIAGKRAGLDGDRSSLVREIFKLLEEFKEENRPEWLIYENVKGMLSSNRGLDYLSILSELDRLGYDAEWQIINSKWWVPQNRERVYTVGHLRRRGSRKILPVTGTDGKNNICQIIQLYGTEKEKNPSGGRVYDINGICMTTGAGNGMSKPQIAVPVLIPELIGGIGEINFGKQFRQGNRIYSSEAPSMCLTSQPVGNTRGQTYLYGVKTEKEIRGKDGIYAEMPGGFLAYCVWYEKYQCYIAIRKLTPKECFRLQGWTDDYFEKAAFVNSDSQLYKQAGNGVTVDVLEAIGRKL